MEAGGARSLWSKQPLALDLGKVSSWVGHPGQPSHEIPHESARRNKKQREVSIFAFTSCFVYLFPMVIIAQHNYCHLFLSQKEHFEFIPLPIWEQPSLKHLAQKRLVSMSEISSYA